MTHGDHPRKIQGITLRQRGGEIEARSRILERGRPTSACLAYSSVLDRPGRNPILLQGRAEITGITEVVLRFPPSSMEENHQRHERAASRLRDPEISELIGSSTVVDAMIRGQQRPGKDVHSLTQLHHDWGMIRRPFLRSRAPVDYAALQTFGELGRKQKMIDANAAIVFERLAKIIPKRELTSLARMQGTKRIGIAEIEKRSIP